MNEKLISIIIPVYNGGKYISRMVDSILNQTYSNFELIIVNDGSIDDTAEVLNKYRHLDKIVIIDKENTGVSDTRNQGFIKSRGEYIIFLDADDFIENNFLEALYNAAIKNNSDISMCQYKEIIGEKTYDINDLEQFGDLIPLERIRNEIIPNMIAPKKGSTLVKGLVWRTLIKRSLMEKTNLKFDSKISIAEDMIFLMQLYYFSNSIAVVKDNLYNYYRYEGSTLTKYHKNNFEKNMYFHETLINILKTQNIYDDYEELYLSNRFSMYTTSFSNCMRSKERLPIQYEEFSQFYNNFFSDNYVRKIKFKHVKGLRKLIFIMMKLRMKWIIFILFKFKHKLRTIRG